MGWARIAKQASEKSKSKEDPYGKRSRKDQMKVGCPVAQTLMPKKSKN